MTPDVVIVGGGAIGACTALELARRGAKVTLLERGAELAWGCSAGNAGLLCPSHSAPIATPAALRQGLRWLLKPDSPFYLRPRPSLLPWLVRYAAAAWRDDKAEAATQLVRSLSLASLALHAKLADSGLDTGFERRGILNAYESEAGFAAGRREAEAYAAAEQRVELLSPAEARELEPALGLGLAGAVYYPEEAHCDPLRFVQAVGRAAADAGAEIRTRVEALALRRRNGGLVVDTNVGELRPETVVLAAGAWTARLARGVGVFLPLEGGKGYHLDLEPAAGDPRIPIFMQESRVIATPLAGRLRLAGTLELAGLDLSVSRARVEAIRRAAARVLAPRGERRVLEVWRGLRPCMPDGLPVIGRPAGLEALVLATGHAMKGLALAPVTGRLVSELVAGERGSGERGALSPDRFRPLLPR